MMKFFISIFKFFQIDFSQLGTQQAGDLTVEIIDGVTDYIDMLKSIFDFDAIKEFFNNNKEFKVLFDGMNGGKFFFFYLLIDYI